MKMIRLTSGHRCNVYDGFEVTVVWRPVKWTITCQSKPLPSLFTHLHTGFFPYKPCGNSSLVCNGFLVHACYISCFLTIGTKIIYLNGSLLRPCIQNIPRIINSQLAQRIWKTDKNCWWYKLCPFMQANRMGRELSIKLSTFARDIQERRNQKWQGTWRVIDFMTLSLEPAVFCLEKQ